MRAATCVLRRAIAAWIESVSASCGGLTGFSLSDEVVESWEGLVERNSRLEGGGDGYGLGCSGGKTLF